MQNVFKTAAFCRNEKNNLWLFILMTLTKVYKNSNNKFIFSVKKAASLLYLK